MSTPSLMDQLRANSSGQPAAPPPPEQAQAPAEQPQQEVVQGLPPDLPPEVQAKVEQAQALGLDPKPLIEVWMQEKAKGEPVAPDTEPDKPEPKSEKKTPGRGRPKKNTTAAQVEKLINSCASGGLSADQCRKYLALLAEAKG